MLAESAESSTNDAMEDVLFLKKDVPRKRSKVSRACDACRRKKIRCNAEYLATLLRVTKMCTNCSKTGESCLFSRVPLKRGPSKGYIRELVDHMDGLKDGRSFRISVETQGYRPLLKLMDVAGTHFHFNGSPNGGLRIEAYHALPPPPISQILSKPYFTNRPKFTSGSHITQPIILPPIVGLQPLTQPVKLSLPIPKYSSVSPLSGGDSTSTLTNMPTTTHNRMIIGENGDHHRIQGPLWRVSYEMPSSSTSRSNISSPSASNGVSFDSRRSSVDSMSSILTSGSMSRLPLLKPLTSVYSDLEDVELMSSGMVSPRDSVSSLLSLNGRGANNSMISSNKRGPHSQYQNLQQQKFPAHAHNTPLPFQPQVHFFLNPSAQTEASRGSFHQSFQAPAQTSPKGSAKTSSFEGDLRIYYKSIHAGLPLLSFDELLVPRMVSELQRSPELHSHIINFFFIALNNLINYQWIPFEVIKGLLVQFTSIYPLSTLGSPIRNEVLYLTIAGVLLVNYTILLRGDSCSMAIAMANGVFTDFKVLQRFKGLSPARMLELSCDDIQLYLPRLHICLQIIDNCHALSWGTQSHVKAPSSFSLASFPSRFSPDWLGVRFLENVEMGKLLAKFKSLMHEEYFNDVPRCRRYPCVASLGACFDKSNLVLCMFALQKDKCDLFDFAIGVTHFFEDHPRIDFDDEYTRDHTHDYQLNTSSLVKKLSQSILAFLNYISILRLHAKGLPLLPGSEQILPFLNLSYGQSLRLIKISKSFMDSLIANAGDDETISRSIKIINDLSVATNLLIGNINQNSSDIEKSRMVDDTSNSLADLLASSHNAAFHGPGVSAIQVLFRRIEIYDLNFNESIKTKPVKAAKESFLVWKNEFLNITESLILTEDMDGWL